MCDDAFKIVEGRVASGARWSHGCQNVLDRSGNVLVEFQLAKSAVWVVDCDGTLEREQEAE